MKEIFMSGEKRIFASAFGIEDYCNNFGLERSESIKELDFVRNLHAITSHAYNIIPLDGSYVEYKNHEGLKQEINYIKKLGYKGKFAIHPSQVDIINKEFQPSKDSIEEAKLIIEIYENSLKQGKGAIGINGKMVDVPVYKRAINLLKRLKTD